MVDSTQGIIVHSEYVAKCLKDLNAVYVRRTEMVPLNFEALGIRNPVIWWDEPNSVSPTDVPNKPDGAHHS